MFNKSLSTTCALFLFSITAFGQSKGGDSSGGFVCCIGIIAVLLIAVIVSNVNSNAKTKALNEAATAYQTSLHQLKSNPTNPSLRQHTLALGRDYSNLTRDKKGVTIFDEVALSNDINAACAGAGNMPKQPPVKSRNIEERLASLNELKFKGLIDESEYDSRRGKILDEV